MDSNPYFQQGLFLDSKSKGDPIQDQKDSLEIKFEKYLKEKNSLFIPCLVIKAIDPFNTLNEIRLNKEDLTCILVNFGKLIDIVNIDCDYLAIFDCYLDSEASKTFLEEENNYSNDKYFKLNVSYLTKTHRLFSKSYISKMQQNDTLSLLFQSTKSEEQLSPSRIEEIKKAQKTRRKKRKYICKYYIQIAETKEFSVVSKLIGTNGVNMKKIIINSCSTDSYTDVKLRIRGKGSGYREGPEYKESNEALNLCVSSSNLPHYKNACLMVDDLINDIYSDYMGFLSSNNKSSNILSIHKQEYFSGLKSE